MNFRIFFGDFFGVLARCHAISAPMLKSATMPMPVDIVVSNPVVISASGPAYRLIVSLAFVFWCGACRPLPSDDAGLCALARCGVSTWRKDGGAVKDALRNIIPQLEHYHTKAVQRAETYRLVKAEAGRKGAIARWQTPRVAASRKIPLSDMTENTLRLPHSVTPSRGLDRFAANPVRQTRGTADVRFIDK